MILCVNPIKQNDYQNYNKATPGVYLHGALCDMNEFDLCQIVTIPNDDGIYNCIVNTDDAHIPATLYFWKGQAPFELRGLVVAKDDTEGNKDAKTKYEKRARQL